MELKTLASCQAKFITMSHGSGGKDMRDLIEDVFVRAFNNDQLNLLEDQARFDIQALAANGDRLAFTTDSYVVHPIFFPGGDIGSLAVNGTVNDLAVSGAIPLYLTCSMIIEEGFPVESLRKIAFSMKKAAGEAGVKIVTGDTKVVEKHAADKLFINTAGIGIIPKGLDIATHRAKPGDLVLVNGTIGDHGAAILGARSDLYLENTIESDSQSLGSLVSEMVKACPKIHCMRDATRGGIAGVLAEIAESSNLCIRIKESAIPVQEQVRGLCEILGLDTLYLANEGKLVAIVAPEDADDLLRAMRAHKFGRDSVIIGEVCVKPNGNVILETTLGGQRMVDKLIGEQLPRIC